MKKIGILHCINANDVCAGVGCLKSFMNKKDFFKKYEAEFIELGAFFTCNGCKEYREVEPEEDEGIIEKLDRLVEENISIVHVGVCRKLKDGSECPRITTMTLMLEDRGIEVIRGTHKGS